MIVRPENDAFTSGSTWNTRLAWFALIDSKSAAGPSIVIGSAVLLSSSSPSESVIVAAAFPRLKSIVLGLMATLACWTAHRKVPVVPSSAVLVTWKVESIRRSSRASTSGCCRRRTCVRRGQLTARNESGRVPLLNHRNRVVPYTMTILAPQNGQARASRPWRIRAGNDSWNSACHTCSCLKARPQTSVTDGPWRTVSRWRVRSSFASKSRTTRSGTRPHAGSSSEMSVCRRRGIAGRLVNRGDLCIYHPPLRIPHLHIRADREVFQGNRKPTPNSYAESPSHQAGA